MKIHLTLRVDENEDLLALRPLHTSSYIDKGEASIIMMALQPLHTTSYIDKGEASTILLALQPLQATSYIDKDKKMVFLALAV